MTDSENRTQKQTLQDMLQDSPPPDWLREMIAYHRRTGGYRSEDLRRLLGDQTQGVEVGPNTNPATQETGD